MARKGDKDKARRRQQEVLDEPASGREPRLLMPAQSLLVGLAAVLKRQTNQTELASLSGYSYGKVNSFLSGAVGRCDPTEHLLEVLKCRPAEVRILWSCLESWSELDTDNFSDAELVWIERDVAETARQRRRDLKLRLRGGPIRNAPDVERDWLAERLSAEKLREGLKGFDVEERSIIVRTLPPYQTWSFAVICAELSERKTSKSVAEAIHWSELSCLAAERAHDDPSGLSAVAVRGYCVAHHGNALRVLGELQRSEVEMLRALELWEAGEDRLGVLDPGRVLELMASLRSSQRRPAEALRLLGQAAPVSRRPAHIELKRGIALCDLGDYEESEAVLTEASGMVESFGDERLKNVQRYNLCAVKVHLGRYEEAVQLLPEIRGSAKGQEDEIDYQRVLWLEGRIAKGLGDHAGAIAALEAGAEGLRKHGMLYDAALARFEVAALHLEMGNSARASQIAGELVDRLASYGDFEESRKALQLFLEATTLEVATDELARSILRFLYLAAQNRELAFNLVG